MTYDVRAMQERLAAIGFDPGPIDGIMGARTEAAIVAFKASVGLLARPYVGPLTWEALMGAPTPSAAIPWLAEAIRMKGVHERRDKSRLKAWFSAAVAWIDPTEIPWCGAFVATCIKRWAPDETLPANPLGARAWQDWGKRVSPQLGAVMVFWRGSPEGWQGHVAFYWGEDDYAFHVLGGNQSDAVTVTRIARTRFLDARWPAGEPAPGKRVLLTSAGAPLSVNEA